jgi:hypothetical protein
MTNGTPTQVPAPQPQPPAPGAYQVPGAPGYWRVNLPTGGYILYDTIHGSQAQYSPSGNVVRPPTQFTMPTYNPPSPTTPYHTEAPNIAAQVQPAPTTKSTVSGGVKTTTDVYGNILKQEAVAPTPTTQPSSIVGRVLTSAESTAMMKAPVGTVIDVPRAVSSGAVPGYTVDVSGKPTQYFLTQPEAERYAASIPYEPKPGEYGYHATAERPQGLYNPIIPVATIPGYKPVTLGTLIETPEAQKLTQQYREQIKPLAFPAITREDMPRTDIGGKIFHGGSPVGKFMEALQSPELSYQYLKYGFQLGESALGKAPKPTTEDITKSRELFLETVQSRESQYGKGGVAVIGAAESIPAQALIAGAEFKALTLGTRALLESTAIRGLPVVGTALYEGSKIPGLIGGANLLTKTSTIPLGLGLTKAGEGIIKVEALASAGKAVEAVGFKGFSVGTKLTELGEGITGLTSFSKIVEPSIIIGGTSQLLSDVYGSYKKEGFAGGAAKATLIGAELPFAVAGWKGIGQGVSKLQTVGMTKVNIVSTEVLTGAKQFPEIPIGFTARDLLKSFETGKPGEIKAYHATGQYMGKKVTIQYAATRPTDVPGLYVSPEQFGPSPFFTRVGQYGEPSLSGLFESEPISPTIMHIKLADVTRLPVPARVSVREATKFLTPMGGPFEPVRKPSVRLIRTEAETYKPTFWETFYGKEAPLRVTGPMGEKGKAYPTTSIERTMIGIGGKREAEATIMPGSLLTELKSSGRGKYTTFKGYNIPVKEYETLLEENSRIIRESTKPTKEIGGKREIGGKSEYLGYRRSYIPPLLALSPIYETGGKTSRITDLLPRVSYTTRRGRPTERPLDYTIRYTPERPSPRRGGGSRYTTEPTIVRDISF